MMKLSPVISERTGLKISRESVIRAICAFFLMVIFVGSSLGSLRFEGVGTFRLPLVIGGAMALAVVGFLCVPPERMFVIPVKNVSLLVLWILFALSMCISSIFHGELPTHGLWFLFGVPVIYFFVIPRLVTERFVKLLGITLLIVGLGYFLLSVLFEPIGLGRSYKGIFMNPNSMGAMAVIVAIGAFMIVSGYKKKGWDRLTTWIVLVALLLSFIFVLLSASRTSLLAFAIVSFVFLFAYIRWDKRFIFKLPRYLIVSGLLGSFLAFLIYIGLESGMVSIWNAIVNKTVSKSMAGDLLSSRNVIWQKVLSEVKPFGYGTSYFENVIGDGAHNTFISLLGTHGLIPPIFLAFFTLTLLVKSWRDLGNTRNFSLSLGPLVVVVAFLVLSMGEDMFGGLGGILTQTFFLASGISIIRS